MWDVLADFGAISSWAANVDHSCLLEHGPTGTAVGTSRRVQVGRDTLVERITEFDRTGALAYDIEGLPRRLRRVANRWTLAPAPAPEPPSRSPARCEIGANPASADWPNARCADSWPNSPTRCSPDWPHRVEGHHD